MKPNSQNKYYLLILLILLCQCTDVKSDNRRQTKGDYITLEMVCGHFMTDHGTDCDKFRQSYNTRIRKFVFNSNEEEYKTLMDKFKYFKTTSFQRRNVDTRVRIEKYEQDTLTYFICMSNIGIASISNNPYIHENDSLINYLYRTYCSPKYDSIFYAR